MSKTAENGGDDCIIQRCLDGDSQAFSELVLKYQDRLFNTLVRAFGDRGEAEDVVQEAFLQSYTKLKSFRRDSAFYTWLYRIAFNISISRRRRKRPTMSVDVGRDEYGQEPEDQSVPPDHNLEQCEQAEMVHEALNAVSDDYRRILVLREMDSMDYEAIADVLELPIGTVRSRLHRARSQLKTELERLQNRSLTADKNPEE